jgi:predicted YcjX-like family ATPase
VTTPARRGERETQDVVKGVQRMIRAVGRRVAGEDIEDLPLLVSLVEEAERQLQLAVTQQRHDLGRSWSQIGAGLGMSKQAAQQRFGRVTADDTRPRLAAVPPSTTS